LLNGPDNRCRSVASLIVSVLSRRRCLAREFLCIGLDVISERTYRRRRTVCEAFRMMSSVDDVHLFNSFFDDEPTRRFHEDSDMDNTARQQLGECLFRILVVARLHG